MNGSTIISASHSLRRAVVVSSALLLLAGGSVAVAANTRPVRLSEQAYRAQVIRGEALNKLYGLGHNARPSRADEIRAAALNRRYDKPWTRVSPAEFTTLVSAFGPEVTATMTPQQARAELARGQGRNRWAKEFAAAARAASTRPDAMALHSPYALSPRPSHDAVSDRCPQVALSCRLRSTENGVSQVNRALEITQTGAPVTRVVVQSGGFGWGDAGIGAGGALGLVFLLGTAGSLVLRQKQRLSNS